jgi:hypothetical protein
MKIIILSIASIILFGCSMTNSSGISGRCTIWDVKKDGITSGLVNVKSEIEIELKNQVTEIEWPDDICWYQEEGDILVGSFARKDVTFRDQGVEFKLTDGKWVFQKINEYIVWTHERR